MEHEIYEVELNYMSRFNWRYRARIIKNRIRRSRVLVALATIVAIARLALRGNKASLAAALTLPILATQMTV
jgi:hypothetical protein